MPELMYTVTVLKTIWDSPKSHVKTQEAAEVLLTTEGHYSYYFHMNNTAKSIVIMETKFHNQKVKKCALS